MKKIINVILHVLLALTLAVINMLGFIHSVFSHDSILIGFAIYIALVFIPSSAVGFAIGLIIDSKTINND